MNNTIAIHNRNDAFHSNLEKLSQRRKTVYRIIKNYGQITASQIKDKMMLGINQVSGRITELKKMCLIVEVGSVKNEKSNTNNTLYRTTTKNEQIDLINKRYQELIDEQKELENDYNLGLSNYSLEVIKKRISGIKKEINQLSKFADL